MKKISFQRIIRLAVEPGEDLLAEDVAENPVAPKADNLTIRLVPYRSIGNTMGYQIFQGNRPLKDVGVVNEAIGKVTGGEGGSSVKATLTASPDGTILITRAGRSLD